MAAFAFATPDIRHFRFNAGLVYLGGSLNHFKSDCGVILLKRDVLIFYPLFSISYKGLTGRRHPLFYMT
jgi:hypothetical protein